MVIFNRSHYEDVLVPVVKGWITKDETQQRYAHINDFERMLTETGTIILKFMLHISKEEQRLRLQERLDDPTKRWKFAVGDLEERTRWDDYQAAYSDAIAATGTPWAPWTIVPADSKTHRNLMIATVVKQALLGLKLRYPPGDPALGQHQGRLSVTRTQRMTELAADYKALADYRPRHKVRFVTAASLFDGHDAAINVMRRHPPGRRASR